MTERRHFGAAAEAVLREAALARLAAGDEHGAAELAARLVRANPLDENYHVLLVRSLAAAGDGIAAARQAARCTQLFRRELGVEPSPALAVAAQTVTASPTAGPVSGRPAAKAQLQAGQAAVTAGALEAGLQCLRRAVSDARAARDAELHAHALVALGSALVHAARGQDEEAAAAPHEALAVAVRSDLTSVAAAASRELGYAEFLQGRYERAQGWLTRAEALAGENAAGRGRIGSVLGSVLCDTAHCTAAAEQLREARRLSAIAGDWRQAAYTLSMLGRTHLLCGELDTADGARRGAPARPTRELGRVHAVARRAARRRRPREGRARRGPGALRARLRTGLPSGRSVLEGNGRTRNRPRRRQQTPAAEGARVALRSTSPLRPLPDAYLWVEAYTLDALCSIAIAHDVQAAPAWIDELAQLAGRRGTRELVARAYGHRARLGGASALTAAQLLAASIDNPALSAILDEREAAA